MPVFKYAFVAGLFLTFISIFIFRKWRIWTLYFVVGAVGVSLMAVYCFHVSAMEEIYRNFITAAVWKLLQPSGWLLAYPYGGVILFKTEDAWVSLLIDLECMGFIEMVIYGALMIFYPAFAITARIKYLISGLLAIWCINILRLLLVIGLIKFFGVDMTHIAHTIIGRLFFFVCVMGVYWYFFSQGTVERFKALGERA